MKYGLQQELTHGHLRLRITTNLLKPPPRPATESSVGNYLDVTTIYNERL